MSIHPYPPSITPDFMGVPPPPNVYRSYPNGTREFFQNYRDANISRIKATYYEYGGVEKIFVPQANMAILNKGGKMDKVLKLELPKYSMLDKKRQSEIDTFFMMVQKQRDFNKDRYGGIHPLDYFTKTRRPYQCAPDPTDVYMKIPTSYVKYKHPLTLPLSLDRIKKFPDLPERALTGVYDETSCNRYKR